MTCDQAGRSRPVQVRNVDERSAGPSRRRVGVLLLATLAAGAARPMVMAAEAAAGDIQVLDLDWVDVGRGRPVPVRLYWPSTFARGGRVPLVVFSHGLGQSRGGFTYLARAWSARGVASLHVQHVGSDNSMWGGNPFALLDRIDAAAHESEAMQRARDVSFALDGLLGRSSPFAPSIDPHRIAAAGHSYGANTTLLVAGARAVRGDRVLDHRDARVRAGIVISALRSTASLTCAPCSPPWPSPHFT